MGGPTARPVIGAISTDNVRGLRCDAVSGSGDFVNRRERSPWLYLVELPLCGGGGIGVGLLAGLGGVVFVEKCPIAEVPAGEEAVAAAGVAGAEVEGVRAGFAGGGSRGGMDLESEAIGGVEGIEAGPVLEEVALAGAAGVGGGKAGGVLKAEPLDLPSVSDAVPGVEAEVAVAAVPGFEGQRGSGRGNGEAARFVELRRVAVAGVIDG